jgi:hypothetical protein
MPVEVLEHVTSRRYEPGERCERSYIIRGTASEADAATELLAAADLVWNNLQRRHVALDPVCVDEGNVDACLWTARVEYQAMQSTAAPVVQPGEQVIEWDTTGGTQHITQGYTETRYGANAPDLGKAIGVDGDGRVQGVDVPMPAFRFTVTRGYAAGSLPNLQAIYALSGQVNASAVSFADTRTGQAIALAAGECRFLGASNANRGDGSQAVVYHFEASPNATDLSVGDMTGIDKAGWDYLWVYYVMAEVTAGGIKRLMPRPKFVYINETSKTGDFSTLGLA